MVCPCGVSSVALFTLPAAFAKFNALPAPKKKAAALFLVPVVAVLTALCVLRQTLPPLAPHPFSRVWASPAGPRAPQNFPESFRHWGRHTARATRRVGAWLCDLAR